MSLWTIIHIREGKVQNPAALKKLWNEVQERKYNGKYIFKMEDANKRTNAQNSWFHAVLPEITKGLRDAGFNEVRNEEDAKAVVKSLFFKKVQSNGVEEIPVIEGTSDVNKLPFAEKADQIIEWAKDYLGIDIAPPGKQLEIDEPSS